MRHHITLSITSCLLAALLGAVGCGGPSKAGLEAREQAYGRIDQVNTQISYSQARQSFETGQLRDALDLIQDAVDRYPQSAEYHLLHGRILIELHRLDAARASLEAAIERDDQLHEAHYFLGIVHQRWSEDEEAFAQYQRASELEETKPQYLLAAAESLIALQRYDEAKSLVHHRLRRFEHHPAFRHLLGQIARLQGDLAGAARLYEEASLLQPDDLQLVVEVANAQFAAGDVPGCLDTLRVLEMRGHDFEPQQQLLRARCLVQANRCIYARPLYRALCTEHPHDEILWTELGWLSWMLEDWRGLRDAAEQVTSLNADASRGWLLLAVADRATGQLADAESHLLNAVQCADVEALAWVILARVRMQQGDSSGAAEAMRMASALDEALNDHPLFAGVVGSGG